MSSNQVVHVEACKYPTRYDLVHWRDFEYALEPILGQRGITELLKHAMRLNSLKNIRILSSSESDLLSDKFLSLDDFVQHLAVLDETESFSFFQNVRFLLADIVGVSLSNRLLESITTAPVSSGT